MNLEAGRTYYLVYRDSRWHKSHLVKVTRMGRKWAYIARFPGSTDLKYKVHLNGKVEESGFGIVGQLYKSEEDYDEQTLKQRVEMVLRRGIPEGVPTEDLREAVRLLRLEVV